MDSKDLMMPRKKPLMLATLSGLLLAKCVIASTASVSAREPSSSSTRGENVSCHRRYILEEEDFYTNPASSG